MEEKLNVPLNKHCFNLNVLYDTESPKRLINLPYLFEKFLDPSYSRMFANPKTKFTKACMERGFYPNVIMTDVPNAVRHYGILSKMLKLDNNNNNNED